MTFRISAPLSAFLDVVAVEPVVIAISPVWLWLY